MESTIWGSGLSIRITQIFQRTQGEHESVVDYLTCLHALFSRMSSPWPLVEQLNFAHQNMLSRLQIAIHRTEFVDFSTLEYLATRIERSFLAEKNYRPPLPSEQSIFPDLAYYPKGKTKNPATVTTIASTKKKLKSNKSANTDPRFSQKYRHRLHSNGETLNGCYHCRYY